MRWLLGALLLGCSAPAPPPAPSMTSALAAVLGALVCPEVADRTFALASGNDEVIDTYVRVQRCQTGVERDDFAIDADADVSLAVDRELGPVAVRSFVHGTLHVKLRSKVSARDDGQRLIVTLEPRAPADVAVETVGLLDLAAQDWASLIALELAPSAGVSPERVAKTKVKKEAERALRDALAKPITVLYDARTGATSWAGAPAPKTSAWRKLRVAAHGSAIVGPFAASAVNARVRTSSLPVAVRPVCLSHASHLLDADRRGDRVAIDDWTTVTKDEGTKSLRFPAMPCSWVLALRTADAATIAEVELPPVADEARLVKTIDRWVSLDELALDAKPEDPFLSVVATTGTWSETLGEKSREPAIVILAPDEEVHVRLVRQDRENQRIEADGPLDLATPGEHQQAVSLASKDIHVTVNMRARVLTP
jgi:hypothetical protein